MTESRLYATANGESVTPAAAPTTIDICMVGDVLLHPSVWLRPHGGWLGDFSHLFANVSDSCRL